MSDLKFSINAEELAKEFGEFKKEAEKALEEGVQHLAQMTHAKIASLAQEKLKTTRKKYMDALDFKEVVPGLWVVSLDESALFIEDGRKSGSMIEDLLRNGAKTSKDGSRYKSIPFEHSKPPSQQGGFEKILVDKIKAEFRKQKIPFKKLELDASGSPRLGKLHTMNLPSPYPSSRASHEALHGLSVFQTKTDSGNVRRDILTFRTVSSKQEGSKWIHPGLEARNFFEEAFQWAEKLFDQEILPGILDRFK